MAHVDDADKASSHVCHAMFFRELEEQALQLLKEMDSMRILRKEIEQVLLKCCNLFCCSQ